MFEFIKHLFGGSSDTLQPVIQKGAIIIDVRTKAEFNQGHVKGSKNIPLNEIKLKSDIIRSWGKPIITVCRSGNRSGIAKSILQSNNIESYNGGAWNSFKDKYAL